MLKIFTTISNSFRDIWIEYKNTSKGDKIKSIVKCIIFILPVILGLIGFSCIDEPKVSISDSLFNIVLMFMLGYGDSPPNIYIQLARWIAPLATASFFYTVLSKIGINIHNNIVYIKGGSVAVYGKDTDKQEILAELEKKGIDGGETMVKAERYILLDDEENNIDFYHVHASELANHDVYMKTDSQNVLSSDKIKSFCPEETAARLFWKQPYVFQKMYPHKDIKKIVMIGFGKLGEQLLYWGLLNMIFSPDEVIEYHIFGDGDKFKAVHHGISNITDKVIFHDEPWYTQIPLIESTDLAIVAEQQQQMELLSNLMVATKTLFYVFIASSNIIELLDRKTYVLATSQNIINQLNEKTPRLIIFKWKEESQKLSHIFEDDLLETAKRINMRYEHLKNPTKEETKANREKEWQSLGTFKRYSNISVADYHEIRLEMLQKMGIEPKSENIDKATLEELSELEHIRWCRYYYLNNWEHGEIRNEINCTHPNLVKYKDLTEEDKQKDKENIRTLLKIDLTND